VLLQLLFNLGLALMAARASAKYLDIQQLLPFVFRLLTYASGVLFYVDEYVADSTWRLLFELNPFYAFVSLYRVVVLSYPLNDHTLLVAPVASVIALVFGFWWFRRAEREYGHV
jgi:teichoic acid transport system permease protein